MAYNSNFKKKKIFDDQKHKLPGTAPNPYGGWGYYRCTPQKNFRSHILVIAEIWLPSLSPVLWFRYCSSIETHVTQFKSVKIELKKWKLVVRFFMCSWPHKPMKFHTWHRTGTVKGWSIQYLQITHSLLPLYQAQFFVHCFTY